MKKLAIIYSSAILCVFSVYVFPWLLLVTFAPFCYIAKGLSRKKQVLHCSILALLLGFSIMHWLFSYSFLIGLALIILFSAHMCAFLLITTNLLATQKQWWMQLIAILTGYGALMFIQYILPFSPGNFWTNWSFFFNTGILSTLISSEGVTLLIIAANVILAQVLNTKKLSQIITFTAIVVVCITPALIATQNNIGLTVAYVQTNTNDPWWWRVENANAQLLDNLIEQTQKIENVDIIVWPEYAIPSDRAYFPKTFEKIQQVAIEKNATIILGTVTTTGQQYNEERFTHYNEAIVINGQGVQHVYQEIVPPPYEPWIIPGQGKQLVEINGKQIALMLCYEETQKKLWKNIAKQNPDLVISLANNQRFHAPIGVELASYFGKMYAREYALPIIRVSNTGSSYAQDKYGNILIESPVQEVDVQIVTI